MKPQATHLSNLGHLLQQSGQYEKALEAFSAALALEPGYALGWANKATALANLSRMNEARAAVEQALELDPHRPDVVYTAAWLLAREERHAEAIDFYEESLRLYRTTLPVTSQIVRSLNMKAASLSKINRLQEAETAWNEASGLEENLDRKTGFLFNIGQMYCLAGQHQKCVHYMDLLLAITPNDSEAAAFREHSKSHLR